MSFIRSHLPGLRRKIADRIVSVNHQALIQMCDQWLQNMDDRELDGVLFLDIRKELNSTISHDKLLQKMKRQFGIANVQLKCGSNLFLPIENDHVFMFCEWVNVIIY
jgi:hypothetical protein